MAGFCAWPSLPKTIQITFSNFCYHFDSTNRHVTIRTMRQIKDIPQELLDKYIRFEMTSAELSAITGFNPAAIRRAIKRPQKPKVKSRAERARERREHQKTLAHLKIKEIAKAASVSISTANRIRQRYKNVT